ncbi:MAG TPA: ABC transporter permease [Gemmatimonadales bacterium]|nr:ABC transporter permease [Gemmatimonadales bacterium]
MNKVPPVMAVVRGLWRRDLAVLRREGVAFALRTVMNPLLVVFVFTYVLPKSGQGFQTAGATSFATVLTPGLIAVAMIFTGVAAVALPLSVELGATREIEDRILAPAPLHTIPLARIAFGAVQAILSGALVFPIVTLLPATPVDVHVASWPLLVAMLLLAGWTSAALGLFLGTVVKPAQIGLLFALVLTPITFLGCVYYPWASLQPIRWLQIGVLINPLVYMSEGLRTALTANVPHLPVAVSVTALAGLGVLFTGLGVRTFRRRVID